MIAEHGDLQIALVDSEFGYCDETFSIELRASNYETMRGLPRDMPDIGEKFFVIR